MGPGAIYPLFRSDGPPLFGNDFESAPLADIIFLFPLPELGDPVRIGFCDLEKVALVSTELFEAKEAGVVWLDGVAEGEADFVDEVVVLFNELSAAIF